MNDTLVVLIPSRNGTGCLDLIVRGYQIAGYLGRHFRPAVIAAGSAPWEARTVGVLAIGQKMGVEKFRALSLDADIYVDDALKAANAIKVADENRWNIIAPYRQADSIKSWSFFKKRQNGEDVHVLDRELEGMKEYEEVDSAGLGFYYGDHFTNYAYHSDTWGTEDVHFFHDNNIKPRVAKSVELKTLKSVYI